MRRLALPCLSILVACSGGKTAPQALAAPANVTANPGDGQVTVLWDPVAGAVSYALYTAEGGNAAARTDVGTATSWTAVGLTNGHAYRFSVTATGAGGESAHSAEVSATPAPNLPLAVTAQPADGATKVARNAALTVSFNKAVTAATVTTGSACTGSVLLSADNFATCLALGAPASSDGKTFTLAPQQALPGAAALKLRVTRAVKDANGIALAADFTSGFTTSAELTAAIAVDSTVSLRPVFTVTFNRPALAASITYAPACTGAVRLSADNFASCVALAHSVVAGVDTFTPVADLAPGAALTFQVAGVKDSDGVPLAAPVSAAYNTAAALAVTIVTPADGTLATSLVPQIKVDFSAAIVPTTLTVTETGGACIGSLQLSSDSFATCQPLTFPVVADNAQEITTRPASNLAGGLYKLKVTTAVHTPGGIAPLAEVVTSFAAGPGPAVISTTPADAATFVSRGTALTVAFDKAVTGVTTNAGGTACTGAVQLQAHGAADCVALGAPASADGVTFTIQPSAPLAASTTYDFRIAGVKDANGIPMGTRAPGSFTTGAIISVSSVLPADGATGVSTSAKVVIAFSSAVAAASVTATADCKGSVRISGDGFVTCHGGAAATADNRSFTFTPALAQSRIYQVAISGVTDAAGDGMVPATFSSRFITGPVLAVASTVPAANATGVARNVTPSFTFNKPAKASTVAVSACTGAVQLSSAGGCVALPPPSTSDDTTFTLNPGLLAGNTAYTLRIAGVHDVNDVPMAAAQSFTFTTAAALAVTSTTPADAASGVGNLPLLTVNFSRPALGVVASCSGTFQLADAGGNCVALSTAASSNGGATWTASPAAPLAAGTYHAKIAGSVTDSDGVALGGDVTWTFTDTGAVEGAPGEVQNLVATARANGVDLSWTPPVPAGTFAGVHIYVKAAGAAGYPSTYTTASSSPFTLPLTAGGAYDIWIKSFDSSGKESAGTEVKGLATAFSGSSQDFLAGQTALGGAGGSFFQGWTDSEFLAGFTLANGQTLGAANGDALWIAFSTTGAGAEVESPTSVNGGTVIWPFAVDFIVEIKNTPSGLVENLRNVAAGTWCSAADAGCPLNGKITASINGSIVEARFNKSAIGSPASAKVAMIAVATHSVAGDTNKGYVFDLAPASVSAIDTLGTWGSLTSAYAPGAKIFQAASGQSTTAALAPAPALVSFSFTNPAAFTGPDVKLKGSHHPFSYALDESVYRLDLSSDRKSASGTFNLGGAQGELFFKVNDQGVDEPIFASGKDRVFALGGGSSPTESLPTLTWNTAGATSFTLTFIFSTGGNPTGVGGNQPELGADAQGTWIAARALAVQPLLCTDYTNPLPPGFRWSTPNCYIASVTLPAGRDLVTAPLNFKAAYDSASFEGGPGNHVMDDDVINHRFLLWNAGDGSGF